MEIRHLRTFAVAAERESFTRAAEVRELTQAAVSQHVAALEKELSVLLFNRQERGVRLTEQGRRMYDYARQILDLVDEASVQVGQAQEQLSGTLRIATSTVPAEWLLPELLAEFRSCWPRVCESLAVSDSSMAAATVEAGDADLGFVGELPHSSRLKANVVAEDELVLVVSADHPLADTGTTTLKKLLGESLIVREPGSGSRRCVERALEEHGVSCAELTIAMEVNNNDAIRAAVARGLGVAFFSRRANRPEFGLVPVAIRGFHPRRQLYVISDPNRIPRPSARQFLAFVERWQAAHQTIDR